MENSGGIIGKTKSIIGSVLDTTKGRYNIVTLCSGLLSLGANFPEFH